MNRTRKYLVPVLLSYGEEFEKRLHSVWKLAFGVGDIVVVNNNIKLDKHIFILIDTNIAKKDFEEFQDWIKIQPMYEEDYAYDNISTGHLHMFVLKVPAHFLSTFDTFKASQYSKMYTREQIQELFETEDTIKILIKDHDYKFIFVDKINERFNCRLSVADLEDSCEFDFPINLDEEIFKPI